MSRIGGSPQHPVGNGLLAEQFPESRRGFAISAHISGGNVGTVIVAVVGAGLIAAIGWRWVVVVFGVPAVLIALAILLLVRESGVDRAEATSPTAASARRSGPSCATRRTAGSTSPRSSAAAGAGSAS